MSRRGVQPSADPLPLVLPAPRRLPGHLRLESAVPCSQAFDDPDWRFSVDWDGARALLIWGGAGGVRLQGETSSDLTARYPELQAAADTLGERACVIEGVVAVLDADGRPDLTAFGRRTALGADAATTLPAIFLATDMLRLDVISVLDWTLDRRLEYLAGLVAGGDAIQLPDHVPARGRALAEAAGERGLTGLLARRGAAAYHPGVASPDRLRITLRPVVTCVVVGVERRGSGPLRLLLGLHEAGRLAVAGWVTGPHDLAVERWLVRAAEQLATDAPPAGFGGAGGAVEWLRPQLTATVSHHGAEPDGTLRRPTLLAVRDDVEPGWCVRRSPVAPPRSERAGGGFMPTVLTPLPLEDAIAVRR